MTMGMQLYIETVLKGLLGKCVLRTMKWSGVRHAHKYDGVGSARLSGILSDSSISSGTNRSFSNAGPTIHLPLLSAHWPKWSQTDWNIFAVHSV